AEVLFLAAEHIFDGDAQPVRGVGGEDAGVVRAEFAAKAAAHILLDGPYLILLETERLRHLTPGAEEVLRRAPDSQRPPVPTGHAAMRLHRVVQRGWRLEAHLDHNLGFGKPLLHVATHIGYWIFVRDSVALLLGPHVWGAWLECGLGVYDKG